MRKIVKAAGAKSTTYELISDIAVPISSLDYPAGRYGYANGVNAFYEDSNATYIGISKIHFSKHKKSLPEGMNRTVKIKAEGMSKVSRATQKISDPN